ncbi:glycosyltransferase [Amylibacter sp.]|nr:glycosyltransferase [Amylibacter sp.]
MNIIFLIYDLGLGGAELQVAALAKSLKSKGYNVSVVYLSENKTSSIREDLAQNQVETIYLDFLNINYIFRNFRFLKNLLSMPETVVHAHMWKANLLSRLLKIFLKFKLINSVHAMDEGKFIVPILYRILDKLSDLNTTVSDVSRKQLIAQGALRARSTAVVPNALLNEQLPNIGVKKKPKQTKFFEILYVGRLAKEKNPGVLISAASKMTLTDAPIKVNIVGDGPLRSELLRKVNEAGLEDCVIFHGAKNPALNYAHADLVVIPSLQESFSLVLTEAAFCEVDFIASTAVPVLEVLNEQIETFDPHDTESLCRLIRLKCTKPLDDITLRNRRDFVSQKYKIESIIALWDQHYRKLLKVKI